MKRIFFVLSVFAVCGGVVALYLDQKFKLDKKEDELNKQFNSKVEQIKREYTIKLKTIEQNNNPENIQKIKEECDKKLQGLQNIYNEKISKLTSNTSTTQSDITNNKDIEKITLLEQEITRLTKELENKSTNTTTVKEPKTTQEKDLQTKISNLEKDINNKNSEIVKLKKEIENVKKLKQKTIIKEKIVEVPQDCPKLLNDKINDLVSSFDEYKYATSTYTNIKCGRDINGRYVTSPDICKDIKNDHKTANMILNELEIITKEKNIYNSYKDFIENNRYTINQ